MKKNVFIVHVVLLRFMSIIPGGKYSINFLLWAGNLLEYYPL